MSTLNAPVQSDRKAWAEARIGAFTGSTNADLMTEPRSKAAKEAGELSESARTLIAQKATEIVKGAIVRGPLTYPMKRGMALERAMRYLLSEHWQVVDRTSLQRNGVWIATPDGLLSNGEPCDIKCADEVTTLRFADEVPDGDWNAMKAWSKTYAYQIATQAAACGSTHANLIYCTDQIKAIPLSEKDVIMIGGEGLHDEHGGLVSQGCQEIFDETGHLFEYQWHDLHNEPGFAFIARRFEIPKEELHKLHVAIDKATEERDKTVIRYRAHLAPPVEEVEAHVAELIEGSDVETEEAHDIRQLEAVILHLKDVPFADLKTALASHTMELVRAKVADAIAMCEGTIKKDLR